MPLRSSRNQRMHLEMLWKASLELEKRIATDQLLRAQLAKLLPGQNPPFTQENNPGTGTANMIPLNFEFPMEMCELLARAALLTGKDPGQILQESFAEYYLKRIEPVQGNNAC